MEDLTLEGRQQRGESIGTDRCHEGLEGGASSNLGM